MAFHMLPATREPNLPPQPVPYKKPIPFCLISKAFFTWTELPWAHPWGCPRRPWSHCSTFYPLPSMSPFASQWSPKPRPTKGFASKEHSKNLRGRKVTCWIVLVHHDEFHSCLEECQMEFKHNIISKSERIEQHCEKEWSPKKPKKKCLGRKPLKDFLSIVGSLAASANP